MTKVGRADFVILYTTYVYIKGIMFKNIGHMAITRVNRECIYVVYI